MAKKEKQKGKYFAVRLHGKEIFKKTNRNRVKRKFAELKGKHKGGGLELIEVG